MSKKRLVLMVSEWMDTNKKEDRNEHELIRMSSKARENMGFGENRVELWPVNATGADRENKSLMLNVYQAFQEDLNRLKKEIEAGSLTEDSASCVGFVTTKIFNRICGHKKGHGDIWVSDDIHDTVFGTDPEFLLVDRKNGNVINASHVIGKAGAIGCDGAMIEIRPKPETTACALVKNMKEIFSANKNSPQVGEYSWIATCFYKDTHRSYPVGGHIHVGNPKALMEKSSTLRSKLYKVMNKILDEYLALPLIALDGPDGGKRRADAGDGILNGYGRFGELRTDAGRLEHRTLSGIWLMHPSLSRAVLGTAKAVIDEVFRLVAEHNFENSYVLPASFISANLWGEEFDSWAEIPLAKDMGCVLPSRTMIEILTKSPGNYMTVARLKELQEKLKSLSTYKNNAEQIDGFCEILKIKRTELEEFGKEIQINWLTNKKFLVEVK